MMISAKNFLSEKEKNAVVSAIRAIESNTSGEIRIHIDDSCSEDVLDRAVQVFHHLKMDQTAFRNGVLIYIAVRDKQFAIIGDKGINKKIDEDYWKSISYQMQQNFIRESPSKAIINAVHQIGKTLSTHFPDLDKFDKNELPDEISFE